MRNEIYDTFFFVLNFRRINKYGSVLSLQTSFPTGKKVELHFLKSTISENVPRYYRCGSNGIQYNTILSLEPREKLSLIKLLFFYPFKETFIT